MTCFMSLLQYTRRFAMFRHTILLTNDFVLHKSFVALDIAVAMGNDNIANSVIEKVNEYLNNSSDFSIQFVNTNSETWFSVVESDPYFSKMYVIKYKDDASINEFVSIIKKNKVLSASDIANLVLSRVECTQLKLQKLVYFCYADYLVKTGKKLFAENVLAYPYGPVIESLHDKYCGYGSNTINADHSAERRRIVDSRFLAADSKLNILTTCLKTIKKYQSFTASELVNLTHRHGSPWSMTEDRAVINQETIIKYHSIEEAS